VVVLKGNVAEEVELRRFFTVKTAFEFLERELLNIPVSAQNKTRLVMDEVLKQNVVYDPVNTNRQRQESLESISLNKEMKQKGERIISRGDLVDTKKNRIIESLRNEYFQQVGGKKTYWFLLLGQVLLVSLCVLMVVIFLYLFRKDVYESSQKFSFILLIIFLFSALAAISFRLKLQSIYFLPFCILPILIRIFFDTRIALFTHLSSILIVGLIVIGFITLICVIVMLKNHLRKLEFKDWEVDDLIIVNDFTITHRLNNNGKKFAKVKGWTVDNVFLDLGDDYVNKYNWNVVDDI
jgi:membrane-associated HD superfamily phosphohydrolase